LTMF